MVSPPKQYFVNFRELSFSIAKNRDKSKAFPGRDESCRGICNFLWKNTTRRGIIEKNSRLTDYVRHIDNTKKMEVCKPGSGQLAELSYEVVKTYKDKTLVHVNLITGRHHQIRVQFSKYGHPLVGDLLYGPNKKCDLMLSCCELTIIHPTLKKEMTFKSLPRSKKWDKIIDNDIKNSICL